MFDSYILCVVGWGLIKFKKMFLIAGLMLIVVGLIIIGLSINDPEIDFDIKPYLAILLGIIVISL